MTMYDLQKLSTPDPKDVAEIMQRLEELRQTIEAESISYAEIAELQELVGYLKHIERADGLDPLLLEWAGVKEN